MSLTTQGFNNERKVSGRSGEQGGAVVLLKILATTERRVAHATGL